MRFAIFLREGDQTYDKVNEVPEQLRKRLLAVRSFDTNGMMVDNRLVDGNVPSRGLSHQWTHDGRATKQRSMKFIRRLRESGPRLRVGR